MMGESNTFHTCLRRLRGRSGLTQQELADFSTLSIRAISDLERGRVGRPRRNTVELLADALQLRGAERDVFESAAGLEATTASRVHPRSSPGDCSLPGRDAKVGMLIDLLRSDSQRLVTVTGLPGVGKTWLAAQVGQRLRAEHGWTVTAESLDLLGSRKSLPPFSVSGTGTDVLLILESRRSDGHGRSCGEAVRSLMRRHPDLRVLVDHGSPLGVADELLLPLAPLAVSRPGEVARFEARPGPAAQHFLSCLRRVRPTDPPPSRVDQRAVEELCWLVDGIPGAIEHLAERCRVQPPWRLVALAREDPLAVAASPTAASTAAGLAAALRAALAALDCGERSFMERLANLDCTWTVETAASATGRTLLEVTLQMHTLLVRGLLIRETEDDSEFRVPNVVRCTLTASLAGGRDVRKFSASLQAV
ncbi:helix-turn-helix domain-containing protein [Streptacidiphilus sp. MAP12-16]|uniref:helix-turn-helix domain-containing protein n=1 Tax=Streptacidiphilus sp. MAP12-16 TaxID=3156300 RepID=UPI003515E3E4